VGLSLDFCVIKKWHMRYEKPKDFKNKGQIRE
jgi:hypothetical protein